LEFDDQVFLKNMEPPAGIEPATCWFYPGAPLPSARVFPEWTTSTSPCN